MITKRRVGICGEVSAGHFGSTPAPVCDLPAGHRGWHGADNPPDPRWPTSRVSWGIPRESAGWRRVRNEAIVSAVFVGVILGILLAWLLTGGRP